MRIVYIEGAYLLDVTERIPLFYKYAYKDAVGPVLFRGYKIRKFKDKQLILAHSTVW